VVDIDLADPAVPAGGWALHVDGAVTRPLRLALADLYAMPTVERLVSMCCISNPVGGPLVGNARWTGVPLADLLRQARPTTAAVTLEALAADGYRETYPLAALAGQQVLVAFGMNGAELPREHGYPARLLVPGRYGMKSVKWLARLALLPAPAAGYWEQRGWDPVARIRSQSRIDVPADHAAVPPRFTVAGIAWAGNRRVAGVQVLADEHGPWRPALLEREAARSAGAAGALACSCRPACTRWPCARSTAAARCRPPSAGHPIPAAPAATTASSCASGPPDPGVPGCNHAGARAVQQSEEERLVSKPHHAATQARRTAATPARPMVQAARQRRYRPARLAGAGVSLLLSQFDTTGALPTTLRISAGGRVVEVRNVGLEWAGVEALLTPDRGVGVS
jgi:hypothetical protein